MLARIRRALDPVARETPGESSINEAMLTSAVSIIYQFLVKCYLQLETEAIYILRVYWRGEAGAGVYYAAPQT